jgi:hypothetical protein
VDNTWRESLPGGDGNKLLAFRIVPPVIQRILQPHACLYSSDHDTRLVVASEILSMALVKQPCMKYAKKTEAKIQVMSVKLHKNTGGH